MKEKEIWKEIITGSGEEIEIRTDIEMYGCRAGDIIRCECGAFRCGDVQERAIVQGFENKKMWVGRKDGTNCWHCSEHQNIKIRVVKRTNYWPGDKVRIVENPLGYDSSPGWVEDMDIYKGTIVTLKNKLDFDREVHWDVEENIWTWDERWLSPLTEEEKERVKDIKGEWETYQNAIKAIKGLADKTKKQAEKLGIKLD